MTFSLLLQIYIEIDGCYVKYPDSMATWKVFIGEDHWFIQFKTHSFILLPSDPHRNCKL